VAEPRDARDEFSDDSRAADAAYKALVLAGFMPTLIEGERYGQHHQAPVLKIGKQSLTRAEQARAIADVPLRAIGYSADLSEDWDRVRLDDDRDWGDGSPVHYQLTIAGDE
jgi:hypothetical protein